MTVTIPSTVDTIDELAFYDCEQLGVVNFEQGSKLNKIGKMAFSRTRLNQFVAPNELRVIYDGAFAECANLQRVSLNEGLKELGDGADLESTNCEKRIGVFDASGVRRVVFPGSLIIIGARTFRGCKDIRKVRLAHGLQVLGDECFCGSSLESVGIPKTVITV